MRESLPLFPKAGFIASSFSLTVIAHACPAASRMVCARAGEGHDPCRCGWGHRLPCASFGHCGWNEIAHTTSLAVNLVITLDAGVQALHPSIKISP